ncbi:LysM domain-containing protein [Paenibacillus taihuensis]|uniref:LysM domain-containing protein n=1 Tax=Paenibacillus taihuensis TaxID=1156355 RepID=A0A3D9SNK6_9BACL|nr:LysM peptidoglycan-binding domain-containing protein [Paenibacillus taihuensis]REE90659.1 LysM domain-containing protein [Paenibacillus taihuensis]
MSKQSKWVLGIVLLVMLFTSRPEISNALADTDTSIMVSYSIKPGDTLYAIAKKFYLTGDYERVAKANGLDPKASLKAGTTLELSNPLVLDQYTVRLGDTLYAITNQYFNRAQYMDVLMGYNQITDPNTGLKLGMELRIPLPTGEKRHTVVKGDTIYSLVAQYMKFQDYQQAIARYNGLLETVDSIKAGQVLQIPNPYYLSGPVEAAAMPDKSISVVKQSKSVSLEINVTRNKLYVHAGSIIVKSFDIASGKRQGLTPIGSFEIITKVKNPWYLAKEIPGGDPKNPLGSRWLGLSVPNTGGTKYGIHGTNAPSSIGTNASAGCIRMNNKDVEWLFDTIPTGTMVKIHA